MYTGQWGWKCSPPLAGLPQLTQWKHFNWLNLYYCGLGRNETGGGQHGYNPPLQYRVWNFVAIWYQEANLILWFTFGVWYLGILNKFHGLICNAVGKHCQYLVRISQYDCMNEKSVSAVQLVYHKQFGRHTGVSLWQTHKTHWHAAMT